MKTISIAMATYNGETRIKRQLDSIVRQSKLPDEIVIVDDCSKDKTLEVIKEYVELYDRIKWRVLVNEENLGYKENFAKAIDQATGDIIFLADQDDYWLKNKIEIMSTLMENEESIDVLTCGFQKIDEDKLNEKLSNKKSVLKKEKLIKVDFNKYFYMTHSPGCCFAISSKCKDLFHISCWDGSMPHDEYLLVLSILSDSAYRYNDDLVIYLRHKDAVTIDKMHNKSSRIQQLNSKIICLNKCVEFISVSTIVNTKDIKLNIVLNQMDFLMKRVSFIKSPSLLKLLSISKLSNYEKISYYLGDLYCSIVN